MNRIDLSSLNIIGSKRDVLKNNSLIYIIKSSGPRIEPWGTQHVNLEFLF